MMSSIQEAFVKAGFEPKKERWESDIKITPPHPLPHVSRKALKVVGFDALPVPEKCPYCRGPVNLVNNSQIYGREYGDWPYVYLCRPCCAYVGLHPNTDLPLGTIADQDLRQARKINKSVFLALSREMNWSRREAYDWLKRRLNIPSTVCHWGMFDIETCAKAGKVCQAALDEASK